ncbi:MAG: type I methionyl aminopeptidase [Planctomycetota bacterium]
MSIEDQDDLIGLQRIGQLIGQALHDAQALAAPGLTTADLDHYLADRLVPLGVRSTPGHTYNFPGFACICVNDEAVHAVPGPRVLQDGDLVTVDLEADLDGYVADAARTFSVGTPHPHDRRLHLAATDACHHAIAHARPGQCTREIGRRVDQRVRRHGFRVIRSLYGHGVGRAAHEAPNIPNFNDPNCRDRLTEGLVITIEPIVSAGNGQVTEDGAWTLRTTDHARSAHHEETIVITRGQPLVLTAA